MAAAEEAYVETVNQPSYAVHVNQGGMLSSEAKIVSLGPLDRDLYPFAEFLHHAGRGFQQVTFGDSSMGWYVEMYKPQPEPDPFEYMRPRGELLKERLRDTVRRCPALAKGGWFVTVYVDRGDKLYWEQVSYMDPPTVEP